LELQQEQAKADPESATAVLPKVSGQDGFVASQIFHISITGSKLNLNTRRNIISKSGLGLPPLAEDT